MAAKILTIDDSKTMRSIIKKQITTLGYDALEAADGAEGLQVAAAAKPDLILLDVTMPVMDGRQALVKLRQQPETQKIPVIMVTAEAAKATVVEIIKAGVSDYIVKPFSEEVLGEKIKKILQPLAGAAVERVNILIVDNNDHDAKALLAALHSEHHVQIAVTGEEALDRIMANKPRLILIDIGMPDTIRLQITERIKADGLQGSSKLVALCMKTSLDEVSRASQKGFNGILLKPFTSEEVRSLVNNIIQTQTQFASRKGDIFILRYPSKEEINLYAVFRQLLQGWQQWLTNLATLGTKKMVVDVAQAVNIGIDDLRFFRELATRAGDLGFKIVFVVGEPKSFELKRFWESQVTKSAATFDEAKRLLDAH
jgi:two-component system cell cycle response regulator